MSVEHLRQYRLVYLASAYTRQPDQEAAFRTACAAAAGLMRAGVKVFSPIAHSHPIAIHGALDALDGAFWAEQDRPIQSACDALVILKMPGWDKSSGIMAEIAHAALTDQPTYGLDPETMSLTKWGFG